MTEKVKVFERDHAPGSEPACLPKGGSEMSEVDQAKQKIDSLVKKNRIMLFMKGTRDQPMCGFSAQVVDLLNRLGADFMEFNVLDDEAVRQGVKEYSNWPTIPQLYVDGKFIGGCDITVELYNNGELEKLVAG